MQASSLKRSRGKSGDEEESPSKKTRESASKRGTTSVIDSMADPVSLSAQSQPSQTGRSDIGSLVPGTTTLPHPSKNSAPVSTAGDQWNSGTADVTVPAPSRASVGGATVATSTTSEDCKPAPEEEAETSNTLHQAEASSPEVGTNWDTSTNAAANGVKDPTPVPGTLQRRFLSLSWIALTVLLILLNLLLYCAWHDTARDLEDALSRQQSVRKRVEGLERTVKYFDRKVKSQQEMLDRSKVELDQTVRDFEAKLDAQKKLLEDTQASCRAVN